MINLKNSSLFRTQGYVGGEWVNNPSGATMPIHNPATGELITDVQRMGVVETRKSIEKARDAQPAWRALPAKERGKIMRRWSDLIMQNLDDLALIMTTEQGKPLAEARAEVMSGAGFVEWFAEEARRVYGDVVPTYAKDRRIVITKEPIGVCAGITPWNFPSSMITRKASAALAVGNAMVFKPAEQTPLSALALCVLAEQAGIPAGIFSMLPGSAEDAPIIGGELLSNKIVRKISFTGSTEVGKLLVRQSAETMKRVSMELGGNAPFIVFEDADLDAAVQGAVLSKYRNAGQTCICTNRFYVQDKVYDAFAEKFIAATSALKVGNGLEAGTTVGPLIDLVAMAKVERLMSEAKKSGAQVALGGEKLDGAGMFFAPTILLNVTQDMAVSREEIFGPIAGLMRFSAEEEVIAKANDTPYGLAAYFYSKDSSRIWRVGEALEYGMIGINTGMFVNESAPFGGMKESGNGREGSKHGVDDWLEIKYLCMAGM